MELTEFKGGGVEKLDSALAFDVCGGVVVHEGGVIGMHGQFRGRGCTDGALYLYFTRSFFHPSHIGVGDGTTRSLSNEFLILGLRTVNLVKHCLQI